MWPESIYFSLSDPELSNLRDQLAGRSSTPIYDRLKAEHDLQKRIKKSQDTILTHAEGHEVASFDMETEDFFKMRSSLTRVLLEKLATDQASVHDMYDEKSADIFNSGFIQAVKIMNWIFDNTQFEE